MKAFWGRQGRYFRLSLLEDLRHHQQSQDIVPYRHHQQTQRHSCSQGSEVRHYQGPAPKTPGAASNALGWQIQQRSSSAPPMTQAGGRVPDSTSFQPAPERRLRIICPSGSGTWLGEGNRTAHKLPGSHPKQNKKPRPFCAAPPPSCRPPSQALAACSALDASTTLGSSFSTIKGLDSGEGLTLMGSQHRSSKAFLQIYAFFEHKSGDRSPLLGQEHSRSTPEGWRCSSSPQH